MVLVVLGGLNAAPEFTAFLRFRERAGWKADAIEMLINSQIPTNAVPNWISTLTGLSPDMVGILGNRNLGTTAYDNVFRMMSRFEDKWYCDTGGGRAKSGFFGFRAHGILSVCLSDGFGHESGSKVEKGFCCSRWLVARFGDTYYRLVFWI